MEIVDRVTGEVVLDRRGKAPVVTVNELPSRTIQSEAHLTDIRTILERYRVQGLRASLDEASALYMDVHGFEDFADLQRQIKAAETHFMKLPSKIREVFDHDVAKFLDAAYDDDKRDLLVEAGFIEAEREGVAEAVEPGSTGNDVPIDGGSAE